MELCKKPASNEKEEKHREGLLLYACRLYLYRILNHPSKLKHIEERFRSFGGRPAFPPFADGSDDSKDVDGLLEDLQETVGDYMVCL